MMNVLNGYGRRGQEFLTMLALGSLANLAVFFIPLYEPKRVTEQANAKPLQSLGMVL
jgi:hypothetical protein